MRSVALRPSMPLTLAVAGAVALAAAGGTPVARAAETPEGAVDAVLDAITARDWDAIGPLVCDDERDAVTAVFDLRRALSSDGVDAGPLAEALTVTIDGRSVTPLGASGDRATVQVAGVLRLEADEAAARAWVRDSLAASGQPTDDATIDQFLGFFTAALAEGTDLASSVEVIRQDGAWLLCDTLGGGTSAGSPAPSLGVALVSLCDAATLEELYAATGLALIRATATDGGCQWDTDPAAGLATIRVVRSAGDLAAIAEVWNGGREETVGGRPAWATAYGTWVDLGGESIRDPALAGWHGHRRGRRPGRGRPGRGCARGAAPPLIPARTPAGPATSAVQAQPPDLLVGQWPQPARGVARPLGVQVELHRLQAPIGDLHPRDLARLARGAPLRLPVARLVIVRVRHAATLPQGRPGHHCL